MRGLDYRAYHKTWACQIWRLSSPAAHESVSHPNPRFLR